MSIAHTRLQLLSRRHNWTRTDAEEALARIISGADHLGYAEGSEAPYFAPCHFLLVRVDNELMGFLEGFGDPDDAEPDDPPEEDETLDEPQPSQKTAPVDLLDPGTQALFARLRTIAARRKAGGGG
ncbi:MAG: hypothetical protein OHK0024_24010 [Thalassobaculales bacterium]